MTRQRKAHTKSRGGCLTCKKRRVKCDEAQPTCRRCLRSGWTCSWDGLNPCMPIPSAMPSRIFHTARETRFFDFFRHETIADLSGWSASYFWQRLVLQMAHSELATRRAVIALGALHAEGPSSSHVLRYYGEALTTLRQLLAKSEAASPMVSIDVCLATCLLLSIFEVARRDYDSAQIHYSRGVQMLKLYNPHSHSPSSSPSLSPTIPSTSQMQLPFYERTLLAQFSHLETAIISFLNSRPGYHQDAIFVEYDVTQLAIPLQFATLDEATESFVRLLHSIQNRATRTANQLAFAKPDSVPDDQGIYPHRETYSASMRHGALLRAVFRESLVGLTRWSAAFYACLACSAGGERGIGIQQRRVVALLKGLSTMVYIRCSREPELGQMAYDMFLPQYEFALRQLEIAVDLAWMERARKSPESPETQAQLQPQPLFSLGLGILNALHDLISGCRDSGVRQRGLDLLERMPYQEGLWTGRNARRAVGAIVEIEEKSRIPGIYGREGIQTEDRIVGVNFQYFPGRFKIIADRLEGREVAWVRLDS